MPRSSARLGQIKRCATLITACSLIVPTITHAQPAPSSIGQPETNQPSANGASALPLSNTPFEAILALNLAGGPFPSRILNPEPADYTQNGWQVALVVTQFSNNFRAQFCGGSYLGDRWVVTAAHCAVQNKNLFAVFFGSKSLDSGGQRMPIREVHMHPNYSRYGIGADIALLELEGPLAVQSIAVVTQSQASTMKSGDKVRVTGWGVINQVGINSKDLMQANLPLQAPAVCNATDAYNGKVPPDMMCAGNQTGAQDTCRGDSGGPVTLVVGGARRLVGIISAGEKCGEPKKYGIYTRVGTYESWIDQTIRAADAARAAPLS